MLNIFHPAYDDRIAARLAQWRSHDVARRLLSRDATLWTEAGAVETADDPIAGRLGWLDLPASARASLPAWRALADDVAAAGIRHVLLLGMGGSSLGAEMLVASLGPTATGGATMNGAPSTDQAWPELIVCDSTHPAFVRAVDARIDLSRTLVIAASKSGTTVETTAHLAYWWARLAATVDDPGAHCIAITDPGTSLADLARARGFRAIVDGVPDVGGRFGVLSAFGLVPAMLCGVDVEPVLDGAAAVRAALVAATGDADPAAGSTAGRLIRRGADRGAIEAWDEERAMPWADQVSGLTLGAWLGEYCVGARASLAFVAEPRWAKVPAWIEQLVAESLGKAGKGLFLSTLADIPKLEAVRQGEAIAVLAQAGLLREGWSAALVALLEAGTPYLFDVVGFDVVGDAADDETLVADLGALIYRWEVATATAALVLGVQPFDQPDVEAAKRLARSMMAGGGASIEAPSVSAATIADVVAAADGWLAALAPGTPVAVQAYLAPNAANDAALAELVRAIEARSDAPVAVGYGPAYLHSTGQLHKGGPTHIRCLQIIDARMGDDVAVPGSDLTFGRLIAAQAAGDAAALTALGRPPLVVRIVGGA